MAESITASSDPLTLDRLLHCGLAGDPDELALVSATTHLSWRELEDLSTRLAKQYLALGLEPGERVASLMPNRPALVVHYLACMKAGLVATPLNYRYMPPEIDHALEVSGAAILVHHAERDADVAASRLGGKLPRGVIRYKADDDEGPQLEQLMAAKSPAIELPAYDPAAPVFIYFTSGSTGKPKGVTHSGSTFTAVLEAIIAGMELTADDTLMPASSFSHIGGSTFGLSALAVGARVVMPRGTDGPAILPLLESFEPTVLWMLPAALVALVRDHDAASEEFASIRLCLSGGDKVSAELEKEFSELTGFPIDEGYGMSEIGLATINPPTGENRLGSVGKLVPRFEMSLRSEQGDEIPVGEEGRLWVRSPSVTVGYWGNEAATAETIVNGWLDTGDVMRVDSDGYLWFCGRKSQIIVHDGSNICPQEVEEALQEHPAVEAAGVIGIHDLVHGENVRAYVMLRSDSARPTSAELIAFARQRVGYKAPEEIVILESMPLNATGKTDRVALKRMAQDQHTANSK